MNIEVRVPISPQPHFFRQVKYLRRAFDARGGQYADARFLVSVGEDCEPYDLAANEPWSRGRIDWHWVNRDDFRAWSYHATTLDRYGPAPEGDVVIFLDADTMLIDHVDDVLDALAAEPAIAGVIAHTPPTTYDRPHIHWNDVFAALGRTLPVARFQHSGWGGMLSDPAHRFSPAYYNYGVVFFPRAIFTEIAARIRGSLEMTAGAPIHPGFRSQLGLTLAIYDTNARHVALDLRYNFPNDGWADELHGDELANIRIIHYLREHVLGPRRETWGDDNAFEAFLARTDLSGSNEVLRRAVAGL